jgi:hypothetical protein
LAKIKLNQQTRQLATATVGQYIQLKQQTRQLATATVGQDTAEVADTTAGNSNSWLKHAAGLLATPCQLTKTNSWRQHQLAKSTVEATYIVQLTACYSYQNHS